VEINASQRVMKLVEQHPNYRTAVEAVIKKTETRELSTDWPAVSKALKALGIADSDAMSIAMDVSARVLVKRYDPDGALRAKGLPEADVKRTGEIAECFLPDPKEERLRALSKDLVTLATLRVDVELVNKREALTESSSALGRRTMARQTDLAALRLQLLAKALEINLADLMAAVDKTVIDGQRADKLIEAQFSEYLPKGTVFDRAHKSIQLVSPEAYAQDGRSWLQQTIAKLLRVKPRVPHEMPRLERNGRVLIAATEDHFGKGGMVPLGLREYAHPKLVGALGGDRAAELMAQGLACYLGEWVNEQFDPATADRRQIEGAAIGVKGRPHSLWVAVDAPTPGHQLWSKLANSLGWEAVVKGFFQDPPMLLAQIESLVGLTGYRQMADALMLEHDGKLGLSDSNKIVDGILKRSESIKRVLPGVSLDASFETPPMQLVTTVSDKLVKTPAAALELLSAALSMTRLDKRGALAAAIIDELGEAGLNGLPAPAFATLGALIYSDGKLFENLAAHTEDHSAWIYSRHDRLPEKLAAGVATRIGDIFQGALAWRGAQAVAELERGGATLSASALERRRKLRDETIAGLNEVLAPYLAADKLTAVLETVRNSRGVDMRTHDAAFAWAEIVTSGRTNTRGSHLLLGDKKPWACVLETGDAAPYIELALHVAQSPEVAAAIGDDIAHAMHREIINHIQTLASSAETAQSIAGFGATTPGHVADQIVYNFRLVLEKSVKTANPAFTDKQVERAVTDQLLRVALQGRLDILRHAFDTAAGANAFDALCTSLKTVSRDFAGLEQLRPQLKRVRV
jgi:hypothetical protein